MDEIEMWGGVKIIINHLPSAVLNYHRCHHLLVAIYPMFTIYHLLFNLELYQISVSNLLQ